MITVKVDSSRALAKFGPQGIPEAVRRSLRRIIPDLAKRLGAAVDANLTAGLKTRSSLTVKKEMVENPTALYGRVTTVSSKNPLLPLWLESGTKAHDIVASGAALSFFWPKVGKQMFLKKVHHPGFAGINYSANAFTQMEGEIKAALTSAVRAGARAA